MQYRQPFHLRIITPSRIVFDGPVLGVRVPGSLSPFEVLAGHIPLVSSLEVGEVRITREPNMTRDYLAISGGVIEVYRGGATILADSAEWAREVDIRRAEEARNRALARIRSRDAEIDMVRAEAALSRALNRLSVARHSK